MPWTAKDASGHTKKADTAGKRRRWAEVANRALERGDSEGAAVRKANGVIERMTDPVEAGVDEANDNGGAA